MKRSNSIPKILVALASGHVLAQTDATVPKPTATPNVTFAPLFDCYRVNTAWGFALSGSMIDSHGDIYRYSRRDKGWTPTPSRDGNATYLASAELQAKFAQAQHAGSVDPKALTENSAQIAKAADGKVERAETGTRDAGSSTCHAYILDEKQQRYRDVELGSDGGASDARYTNSAAEAGSLLAWLKSVGVAK